MPGFHIHVAGGHFQNTIAPNPSCCSDPSVLCMSCAKLALSMDRNALTDNALVANDDGLVVNPGVLSRVFDEDDFLPLPVLNWGTENEAARAKAKKKPFVKSLIKGEEEEEKELEAETERQSKKTQMEIMQEEEERLHRENSRRLSRISANLDEDDVLPLPTLNWGEPSPCNNCGEEDKLLLPEPAF